MSIVNIDYITTSGYYTIYVCSLSLDYCELIGTHIPIPPEFSFELPELFSNVQEVIIKIIDEQTSCEDFNYYQCLTPTPTNTVTPTITPSKTVICNCLTFHNTGNTFANISYIQCDGSSFSDYIESGTTYYACGRAASYDSNISFSLGDECINFSCPELLPTPTVTPTPSPTLPTVVGYFQSCCDATIQFVVAGIPASLSPLSGVYAIRNLGFEGCATSIGYFSSDTIYANYLIAQTDGCLDCQLRDAALLCPTPTRTLTPTPTITPTVTPTTGLPPTPTPTITPSPSTTPPNTPTPSATPAVCCDCWSFLVTSGNVYVTWTECDGNVVSNTFTFNRANPPKLLENLGGTTPTASAAPAGTWTLSKIANCTGC